MAAADLPMCSKAMCSKGFNGTTMDLPFKAMLTELLVLHSRLGVAHERELAELKNQRVDVNADVGTSSPMLDLSEGPKQSYDWQQLAVKSPYRPFKERPPPGRLQQVILPTCPNPSAAPLDGKNKSTDINVGDPYSLEGKEFLDNVLGNFTSVVGFDHNTSDKNSAKSQIFHNPKQANVCQDNIHGLVPVENAKSQRSTSVADEEDQTEVSEQESTYSSSAGYQSSPCGRNSDRQQERMLSGLSKPSRHASRYALGRSLTADTVQDTPSKRGNRDTVEEEDELRKMQALWAGMEDEDEIVQAYLDGAASSQTRTLSTIAFELVYSNCFQVFFAVAIMLNSIFLGVEVDTSASNPNAETHIIFYIIGYMFIVLFLFELIARLIAEGIKFFWNAFWVWNWLDFIIVMASLVEIGFDVVNFASGGDDKAEGGVSNMRLFRMIRLTRIIRILRVARIVTLIRALHTLVYQIMGTLRSVFWALVLLSLTIYVFAMVFSQAATNHISAQTQEQILLDGTLYEYWGSLPRCMFTLYKSILGGVDWEHVVRPLSDMHWIWVIMFIGYVSFTFFAMMNVMTGVFCQSAIESAQLDQDMVIQQHLLRKKLFVKKLRNLFEDIGATRGRRHGSRGRKAGDVITFRAFEKHLEEEKVNAYFESLGLDTSDAWGLFKLLDTDESQEVDLDEFVQGCLRLRGHAKAVDVAKISHENKKMRTKLSAWMKRIDDTLGSLIDAANHGTSSRKPIRNISAFSIETRVELNESLSNDLQSREPPSVIRMT